MNVSHPFNIDVLLLLFCRLWFPATCSGRDVCSSTGDPS